MSKWGRQTPSPLARTKLNICLAALLDDSCGCVPETRERSGLERGCFINSTFLMVSNEFAGLF